MRRRRSQLRERRHKAAVPTVALVGYTNAGKTTLFNSLTGDRRGRVERAVRDARSARAPRASCRIAASCSCPTRSASSIGCRIRSSRRSARRSKRSRRPICCCTSSTPSSPDRERHMAAVSAVLAEVGAQRVPVDRRLQQVRSARRRGARAARGALSRRAVRLGADRRGTRRSDRGDGDAARARHRDASRSSSIRTTTRIASRSAQLYRFGRILRHVASDSRVTIEAELPRRLLERFHAGGCAGRVMRRCRSPQLASAQFARAGRRVARARSLLAAACAKKTGDAAAGRARRSFRDFVFPGRAPALATPAVLGAAPRGLATLQAGDPRAADRDFSDAPESSRRSSIRPKPGSATRRWRGRTPRRRSHTSTRRWSPTPRYAPALAGRGEALLALGRTRRGARRASRRRSPPTPRSTTLRSRVDVLKVPRRAAGHREARKAADGGRARRGARRVPGGDCRVAAERVPLSRAGRRSSGSGGDTARPRWCTPSRRVALDPADVRALMLIAEMREAQQRMDEGGRGVCRGATRSSRPTR